MLEYLITKKRKQELKLTGQVIVRFERAGFTNYGLRVMVLGGTGTVSYIAGNKLIVTKFDHQAISVVIPNTTTHAAVSITKSVPGSRPILSIGGNTMVEVVEWADCPASNIRFTRSDVLEKFPDALPETMTSMESMFEGDNYSKHTGVGKWDTSRITNMKKTFWGSFNFNEDIGNWNTSNVTDMESMLQTCPVFNQNISRWNVSKVTTMYQMFQSCSVFNQDLTGWDVSKVLIWNFTGAPKWPAARHPKWGAV